MLFDRVLYVRRDDEAGDTDHVRWTRWLEILGSLTEETLGGWGFPPGSGPVVNEILGGKYWIPFQYDPMGLQNGAHTRIRSEPVPAGAASFVLDYRVYREWDQQLVMTLRLLWSFRPRGIRRELDESWFREGRLLRA